MKPTKSEYTGICYMNRAKNLIHRAKLETGIDDISPMKIASWAVSMRPLLRPSSWRQYRSALIYYLHENETNHPETVQAIKLLSASDGKICLQGKDAPARTSSSKKKSLSPDELVLIIDYLASHKSRWSVTASLWLQASVLTGLRPGEWRSARLEKNDAGEFELVVVNAKNTNGRAHGEMRRLLLRGMEENELNIIRFQINATEIVLGGNLWDQYYRGCRKSVYIAVRALWPRRTQYPTLYTGRHQFAADAKRSGLLKSEVAALMGHASSITAGRHYGKKRSGQSGFSVQPAPEDVARVVTQLDRGAYSSGNQTFRP